MIFLFEKMMNNDEQIKKNEITFHAFIFKEDDEEQKQGQQKRKKKTKQFWFRDTFLQRGN